MDTFSDQWLLRAFRDGDREAFNVLFRRYAARVHATAYRLTGHWEDAEDTLQEVFITLSRKAATIRRESALAAWLYRTTVNRALDCRRRRRAGLSLDEPEGPAPRILAIESLRREARARATPACAKACSARSRPSSPASRSARPPSSCYGFSRACPTSRLAPSSAAASRPRKATSRWPAANCASGSTMPRAKPTPRRRAAPA